MPKLKIKETAAGNFGGKTPVLTLVKPASKKPARVDRSGAVPGLAPLPANRFPALEPQEITFTFFAPQAGEVKVAGSFNDWNPDAAPLKNQGKGEWAARLKLRSGQYEYRFVVDGQWLADPQAAQTRPNPFGELNSVLTIPPADSTGRQEEIARITVLDLQRRGERAEQRCEQPD